MNILTFILALIPQLYLTCFTACLFGNAIHIAFKIVSLSKDYSVANLDFSVWDDYFKKDKWALLLDFLGSMALVYAADEIVDSPYIMGKIKLGFIVIGIGGSYVIMQIASVAKKAYREKVDKATGPNPKKQIPQ